jgi:hypothetical protein
MQIGPEYLVEQPGHVDPQAAPHARQATGRPIDTDRVKIRPPDRRVTKALEIPPMIRWNVSKRPEKTIQSANRSRKVTTMAGSNLFERVGRLTPASGGLVFGET